MTVDAHHDQIRVVVGGTRQEDLGHSCLRRNLALHRHLDAMPGQPCREICARNPDLTTSARQSGRLSSSPSSRRAAHRPPHVRFPGSNSNRASRFRPLPAGRRDEEPRGLDVHPTSRPFPEDHLEGPACAPVWLGPPPRDRHSASNARGLCRRALRTNAIPPSGRHRQAPHGKPCARRSGPTLRDVRGLGREHPCRVASLSSEGRRPPWRRQRPTPHRNDGRHPPPQQDGGRSFSAITVNEDRLHDFLPGSGLEQRIAKKRLDLLAGDPRGAAAHDGGGARCDRQPQRLRRRLLPCKAEHEPSEKTMLGNGWNDIGYNFSSTASARFTKGAAAGSTRTSLVRTPRASTSVPSGPP